jgi:hypothetical protein
LRPPAASFDRDPEEIARSRFNSRITLVAISGGRRVASARVRR